MGTKGEWPKKKNALETFENAHRGIVGLPAKKTIMEFDSILGEFSLETTKFAPVKMLPAQTCSQHVAVEFGRGAQLRPARIATCCARGRGQTKPLLACIACIARQSWHESVRVKVHTHR